MINFKPVLSGKFKISSVVIAGTLATMPCLSFADEPTQKAEEVNQPAATPKVGIPYKGVNVVLGGFLASEMVFRANGTAADIDTAYSKIPFANSQAYGVSEFRGSERQSRFSILAQGDANENAQLTGYYELDFLSSATTSNANQSNSYTPRTRNVYANIDWADSGLHLLAGQNWSLATLNTKGITPRNELLPPTIDPQYAVGFNWERQWQLRLTKDWNKWLWASASFENPQTVGVSGVVPAGTSNQYQNPTVGNLMTSQMSYNSYPDFIFKVAAETSFGHYEVYNLLRNFQSRFGGTTDATRVNKQSTFADAVGAGATIPVLPKVVDLTLSGLYGNGVGRYGTSQLADATYDGDGSLHVLSGTQFLAQATWHFNPELDIYVSYGQEQVDSYVSTNGSFGYGDSVGASNLGCSTLGGTCAPNIKNISQANAAAWWTFYKGNFGLTKLGVQYSHTNLNTYADASGNSPSTYEDMAYTSLRYYPF